LPVYRETNTKDAKVSDTSVALLEGVVVLGHVFASTHMYEQQKSYKEVPETRRRGGDKKK
jgi:hypothetical protein